MDVMDVMDVINILKKYNMYDKAQAECKRKKINEAPYDMQGYHDVYCSYLSKKWEELRDKKVELQNIKCKEWGNIPDEIKPIHDDCCFALTPLKDKYCKYKCKYYNNDIEKLDSAMKELGDAEKVLKDVAQHDSWSR